MLAASKLLKTNSNSTHFWGIHLEGVTLLFLLNEFQRDFIKLNKSGFINLY